MPIGPNGPGYSQLDMQQILQRSFEEAQDRLRVDAQVTAVISTLDTTIKDFGTGDHLQVNPDGSIDVNVVLNAATDNIAIADATSGNKLKVNVDGSINVDISGPATPTLIKSLFNSITAVPSATPTTLITYTVPGGKTGRLERIEVSGDNIAQYDFFINAALNGRKRSEFTELNETFEFSSSTDMGIPLATGDTVVVKVTHNRPFVGAFEARLQTVEVG